MSHRNSWLVFLGITLWWIVFSAVSFVSSVATTKFKGHEAHLLYELTWQSGWLFWCGFTYLVIYLARRYPIEKNTLRKDSLRHLLIGIACASILSIGDYLMSFPLYELFGLDKPNIKALIASLGYKSPLNLFIYVAIVGCTTAYDYYTRFRQSERYSSNLEAKLAQAELQALKAQLQPHFLFNTHHSIISLMLKHRNDEAIKMLTQLSDLLRITLQNTNQQILPLKEELETLELYLGIQRIRFQDRLEVQIDIEPETQDAAVPYLLLQPIVENALKHGVEPLTGKGVVTIEAKRIENRLELIVTDNGPGIQENHTPINGNGFGIKTTRERLAQFFNDRHEFEVRSSPENGTAIRISIPFNSVSSAKRPTP